MKLFFGSLLLVLCLGCGSSQSGTDGLEQDAISDYISNNPNIDAERSMGKEE